MTQRERRLYLIRELLKEQPRYAGMQIPADEEEQRNLLRSLFNMRMPAPADAELPPYRIFSRCRRGSIFGGETSRHSSATPS